MGILQGGIITCEFYVELSQQWASDHILDVP